MTSRPGGVWIDYIRPGLEDVSLIVAAPVTGSLISSASFAWTCTVLLDSLYIGHFVVQIVFGSLDVSCSSGGLANVEKWLRTVRRW